MANKAEKQYRRVGNTTRLLMVAGVIVVFLLVLSTLWTGRSARQSTVNAVHMVSNFYLQELADRREQVVASNLNNSLRNMREALGLLDENDISDLKHLQAFQARMKKLYNVEKFAFVDEEGLIYTSLGLLNDIDDYTFSHRVITGPEISIKDINSEDKKVVIAVPIDHIPFDGHELIICFMEIDMDVMLEGLSLQTDTNGTTFCNLYDRSGISLTNVVLGGLAEQRNLLEVLNDAVFKTDSSYAQMLEDFNTGSSGSVSFTYNGIEETMYYVPVKGTDWMLTYLIREGLINDQINSATQDIITGSLIQSLFVAVILFAIFAYIVRQTRKTDALRMAKETMEAESRVKQQELEERLKLQDQLLEQERQNESLKLMHNMLNSGPWYMDFDEQGQMIGVTWSDTFRRMLGYSDSREFPDKLESWSDLLLPEDRDRVLREFNETINDYTGQKTYDVEYRMQTKSDGVRWFHAMGQLTRRPDGTPITYVGIFVDITHEKEMELALERQQEALKTALARAEEASAAKTSFLSSMSHEIRTPMNAIIGLDSIALKDPDLSDRTREQLEKIGSSSRHLLSLINNILDMSRIESGRMVLKKEEFSFREMLEQINTMINSQCQDKGLTYDCHVLGHLDEYYIGDDMRIKEVLINILGNAVKFTPEGGTVTFTVEQIARFEDKATIRFVMKDTGVGMEKDYLPKLFDAFSQEDENKANKYGSTGLGMAITKNLVEMMNGSISVDSEKNVGSTFTVTLTLYTSDRKANEELNLQPQDLKVLVIDDDPVACEHARIVLEEVGISSDSCLSGQEALEMLRLAHARREAYNVILVDLRMPEQDGVEVTRKIRELYEGESAIIIITAYSIDEVMEEALHAGVDSFMAKPLFASGILDEIQRVMKRRAASSEEVHKADLEGRHILLAEDIPLNAEIMTDLLELRDVTVDHAENGQLALDLFSSKAPGTYDAILMDVRMPVMNGLEAAAAIRALDRPDAKTIPIIALTANAFDEDVQRSLQAGMNAHLTKPVEADHLFETLETLIQD